MHYLHKRLRIFYLNAEVDYLQHLVFKTGESPSKFYRELNNEVEMKTANYLRESYKQPQVYLDPLLIIHGNCPGSTSMDSLFILFSRLFTILEMPDKSSHYNVFKTCTKTVRKKVKEIN